MLKEIKKIKKAVIYYLTVLDQFHQIVFSAYINRDYFDNQLSHEKKRIKQVRILFNALEKVRRCFCEYKTRISLEKKLNQVFSENKDEFLCENLVSYLEQCYEIFFSLDLLKQRILDHAVFEICQVELTHISGIISQMIFHQINKIKYNVQSDDIKPLMISVHSLEVIFENTIQFVMADPMVFLFFIRDLHAFNNVITSLQNEIQFK